MVIQDGYFYHIADRFFSDVREPSLMSNKENGGYRPHYLAVRDERNPDIFWMVPVSSKYEKYKNFHDKQVAKYKKCTKVVLGRFAGTDHAFLVQNAFPTTSDYFDHIHTRFGVPAEISSETAQKIVRCLKSNLALHKRGISLFFADIDRIYRLMEDHLSVLSEGSDSQTEKEPARIKTDSPE